MTLSLFLYIVATVLLGLAAVGVRAGRVSLVLAAATILVFTFFVLRELA